MAGFVGVAGSPFSARAQQTTRLPVIGFMGAATPSAWSPWTTAFGCRYSGRSVYGFPSLNKYAMDPAKAIRISVQNGNVTLYGVVDNQADKDTANIRAKSVSGVFKVTNDLQVAASSTKIK